MDTSPVYIIIALAAFIVLAIVLFFIKPKNKEQKLSPLISLSFGLILAGIFFGKERWLGYTLIGVGVLLAFAELLRKTAR